MNSAIIVFPGSNRERDAAAAVVAASGKAPTLVWHRDTELPQGLDLIVVPGGFSYGDYLRTGAIAAHSPVMAEVKRAASRGVHVLGVCNGFQILCEAGMLPGVLLRNASLKFVCRDVTLEVATTATPFTTAYTTGQQIRVPVAHHDGNYFADADTVKRLNDEDRVVFRYAGWDNPNGSIGDIAGITDASRRVLGMMPHPENAIEKQLGSVDGLKLFQGITQAFAGAV